MLKLKADLFEYVQMCMRDGAVTVLLPMSPYKKRNGDAVMGAGVLRRFAERFPGAASVLGAQLPVWDDTDTSRNTFATGAITNGATFAGVVVRSWLIQPRVGFASNVYPHLAERFGIDASTPDDDEADVPGWACRPWESAIRNSVPHIAQLRGRVVIPYPNLGGGMSNDAFNDAMGALSDNVTILTGAGGTT